MNFLFKTLVFLNKKGEKKTTGEIMSVVVMMVIIMLYLPLVLALLCNRYATHHPLPKEFAFSTLLLLGTSWLLHSLKQCKENDQYKKLRWIVFLQLSLALVFLFVQVKGVQKIFFYQKYNDIKIVALLVLYHALNLCVIIGLFLKLLLNTRSIHSAADCYIYFLNPHHYFAFRLNILFWNFLCLLWVGLYILFIVKYD